MPAATGERLKNQGCQYAISPPRRAATIKACWQTRAEFGFPRAAEHPDPKLALYPV